MSELHQATPSQVVTEVFARLQAENYQAAASMHTEDFADYALACAIREGTPRQRIPRTADQMLALSPDMPREVAEWEAAQYRKQPAPTPYFGAVHGVDSLEQLHELSRWEVVARRLQAADWRTRLRAHLEQLAEQYPEYSDQLTQQRAEARSQWTGNVVGHVVSEYRAYVVLEESGSSERGPTDWGPRVVTLRPTAAGWRVSSDLTEGNTLVHFHITVEGADGKFVVLS